MEVIDKWPEGVRMRIGHRIDWSEILDGKIRRLQKGVDFEGKADSMVRRCHQAARKRGVQVKAAVDGDCVIVQTVLKSTSAKKA